MSLDWTIYALAASGLVASHAVPSAPGVRPRLIGLVGRPAYLAAYSLLSLLALAAFVWAYGRVGAGAAWLYMPPPYARPVAVALMPLAFLLVVGRLTTRPGPAPAGVYRISRSPGAVGILLWALLHLANTGDARRVVLFLTMAAIAAVALAKDELVLRRAARNGDDAAASWLTGTSIVPFAALARGRQTVRPSEIGLRRLYLALAAYALLLLAHPYLFGVDPLAGL